MGFLNPSREREEGITVQDHSVFLGIPFYPLLTKKGEHREELKNRFIYISIFIYILKKKKKTQKLGIMSLERELFSQALIQPMPMSPGGIQL